MNDISAVIVDSAMKVHSALGPGLLESAYQSCLQYELIARGISIQTNVALRVTYGSATMKVGYRLDLLVENQIVVELKAVSKLLPVHEAQLLSYLKLGGYPLGLLFNFHENHLKDGIKRMINRPL